MSQSKILTKTERKAVRLPDWIPQGTKVMVQLDQVESFTTGGIFIPTSASERDNMNQTEGTVVAMGLLAYADQRRWDEASQGWKLANPVKVGDRVKFQRHHGWVHLEGEGDDRMEYRVMYDTDITMVEKTKQAEGESHE